MREIVHLQAGQCGNQIGAKVTILIINILTIFALILFPSIGSDDPFKKCIGLG